MIVGYLQNGYLDEAVKFFHEMPERDVVSWNKMNVGYVKSGHFYEALALFREMLLTDMKPSLETFPCALLACVKLAALGLGKFTTNVHNYRWISI
jgi:pentatricopeptide repeat protein